jgi:hypothetical protein
LTLEMRSGLARLCIVGALDSSAADAIGGMISFDGPVTGPVELIADGVSAVDPEAFLSVVAAAREREQHGLPSVTLLAGSPLLAEALHLAGLPADAPLVLARPVSPALRRRAR